KAKPYADPDVRRIRDRFQHALTAGYSMGEASAYANGDDTVMAKPRTKAEQPVTMPPIEPAWRDNGQQPAAFADEGEQPAPEAAKPGAAEPAPEKPKHEEAKKVEVLKPKKVTIPADLEDMAWPKLRILAGACGHTNITSREDAIDAIKKYQAEHKE